ncbi:MAG: hypothetical protein HY549_03315 [Elusimicrobia bacterium]|nr:hypothetical protein [Elusimicrobiota bacterium]
MATTTRIEEEIEAAYNFRGHVTLKLRGGQTVEGYLFNRQLGDRFPDGGFVELFLKGSGDRRNCAVRDIEAVELTGEDCAAGKSYEDYLKKKAEQEAVKA